MKKIIALILTITMLMTFVTVVAASDAQDTKTFEYISLEEDGTEVTGYRYNVDANKKPSTIYAGTAVRTEKNKKS